MGAAMTYTITITDPGAEPVTVSLEWTTEAPKVAGLYFAEWYFDGSVEIVTVVSGLHYLYTDNEDGGTPVGDGSYIRWLGPLPLPPSGA